MKTLLFAISTLALVLGTNAKNTEMTFENVSNSTSLSLDNSSDASNVVATTSYKSETIASVQLITLDVFMTPPLEGFKVKAIENDGEIIPVVTLPELNIIAKG